MNTHWISALIIEPHPVRREALRKMLVGEPDLQVIGTAANSAEALLFTANSALPPDVILLAIDHPGLDDLQAIAVWRRVVPAATIIALTASEWPRQTEAALQRGAQAVVRKNSPRANLLNLVRTYRPHPLLV